MKNRLLLSAMWLLSTCVFAQNKPQFAFHAGLAQPINQFAEADTNRAGFVGIGGELMLPLWKNAPLRAGINVRYYWLGKEQETQNFSGAEINYELQSTVRGSMVPTHLVLRFDPVKLTNFPVMPYAGAMIGFRAFNIKTEVQVDYLDGSEVATDEQTKANWTTSYGYELGLHIRINATVMLDFRFERAWGGWGQYLDLSSVTFDGTGQATYQTLNTRTDVNLFTIGVVFDLE